MWQLSTEWLVSEFYCNFDSVHPASRVRPTRPTRSRPCAHSLNNPAALHYTIHTCHVPILSITTPYGPEIIRAGSPLYCKYSRLTSSPPFFLRDSGASETRARVKINPREKSRHAAGREKMRDYRQSPSFWPLTTDWFWSVKFVSPSKSIKRM